MITNTYLRRCVYGLRFALAALSLVFVVSAGVARAEDGGGTPVQSEGEKDLPKDKPMPVKFDTFVSKFNKTAREKKFEVRLAKSKCSKIITGTGHVCNVTASKTLMGIIAGDNNDAVTSMTFIFGGVNANPVDFISLYFVIANMAAPDADKEEYGITFKSLFGNLEKLDNEAEATLHNIKFKINVTDGMGVWLLVESAD